MKQKILQKVPMLKGVQVIMEILMAKIVTFVIMEVDLLNEDVN